MVIKKLSHWVYIVAGILFFASMPGVKAATLSFSPSSGSFNVGDTFSVDVLVDTTGTPIDGIGLRFLRYDPSYLDLVDSDTTQAGTQIAARSLMQNTVLNAVNITAGTVEFSQITQGGVTFTSSGAQVLATATFRVKKQGSSSLSFDFTPGSTIDTNVAANVTDVLTKVSGASFTFSTPAPPSSGGGGGGSSGGSGGGSGGGGGGGGGSYLPSPPSGFTALGGPDQIILRWKNPIDSNFVRARVIRKTSSAPVSASDGVVIYEGEKQEFTDTNVLVSGTTYYYAVFSLDHSLRPSALVSAKATVGALTEAEIMVQIAQINTQQQPASVLPVFFSYLFTLPLQMESNNQDVFYLQKLLNALGITISSSGPGSPGQETTYYGARTRDAVARFQAQYLGGSVGISDRGLVGPRTRAKLNELAAVTPKQPTAPIVTPTPAAYVFTRNLTTGSRGEDVRQLQKFLNAKGFTITTLGDGSPGKETDFFGNLTKAALVRFQDAYASEILVPAGLIKGTGYFGPATRAKIHILMQVSSSSQQLPAPGQSQIQSLQEQIRQAQEQVNRLLQQLQQTR